MSPLVAALVALAVGYALGRVRPIDRLDRVAWWRGIANLPGGHSKPWGVVWMALHPVKTWTAYRGRRRT